MLRILTEICPIESSPEAWREVRQERREALQHLQQTLLQHQPACQDCPQEDQELRVCQLQEKVLRQERT